LELLWQPHKSVRGEARSNELVWLRGSAALLVPGVVVFFLPYEQAGRAPFGRWLVVVLFVILLAPMLCARDV